MEFLPHGRIYNLLECIADWTEWSGAQIYNKLIERPARMLGIRDIDRYENLVWKIGFSLQVFASILSLLMIIATIWMNSFTTIWINSYTIWLPTVFTSLWIILQSKFISFAMAELTRIFNRWLFMWWIVNLCMYFMLQKLKLLIFETLEILPIPIIWIY